MLDRISIRRSGQLLVVTTWSAVDYDRCESVIALELGEARDLANAILAEVQDAETEEAKGSEQGGAA